MSLKILTADLERTQTILYGIGMIALGFWFGANFTGRLAYQPEQSSLARSVTVHPSWYSSVQHANRVALILFTTCMLCLIVVDYKFREN